MNAIKDSSALLWLSLVCSSLAAVDMVDLIGSAMDFFQETL